MWRRKVILIVDDEPRTRQGLKNMLESWSGGRYEVLTAEHAPQAMELLAKEPVVLLISDIRMPEISGLSLVERLSAAEAEGEAGAAYRPAVILISGYAEFEYAQQAIQLGVVNYLLKPIRREKLIDTVERALQIGEERSRATLLARMMDRKLLEAAGELNSVAEPVKEALRYVEEHLNQGLGLRDAAQHVHLNPSYFSVLFKEQMGMTFIEYVTRLRIQRAKELLLQTKLPVGEIAERVGYQTTKYFNKVFKEYEGHSPGSYRNEVKGQAPEVPGPNEDPNEPN
ncbi:DNA-binding response regulator [Paenibacillus faecis]|uniref:response regulator transcription factor n=1 Tax=Paenibacillus faecis TaxID=862114 RepID=UPI001B0DCA53|nr:helix-turn-helix domain-containing protein [Paenibacillus faecis]GIO87648.1 DNA-binding response regulator [Paenibacillus faecis]